WLQCWTAPKERNGFRCRSRHERNFSELQIPVREVAREPAALPVAFVRWIAAAAPVGQAAPAVVRGRIAAAPQSEHSPQLQLPFYSRERALDPQRAKAAREQQSCLLQVGWFLVLVRSRNMHQIIQSPIAIVVLQK